MSLIYITGPFGAGKSTVRNELIKRGYEACDTDEDGMSAWYDNQTLEPVAFLKAKDRPADWFEKHFFVCLQSALKSSQNVPKQSSSSCVAFRPTTKNSANTTIKSSAWS